MAQTIMPTPYIGGGLLTDDQRNDILGSFAGGLLQGYTVNPTPVAGQYFTPIGGAGSTILDADSGTQTGEMTADDFARLMEQYRNQQNLMNESGQADDFDVGSGTYDGNIFDFVTDPNGFFSILDAPVGLLGLARGAMNAAPGPQGFAYDDLEEAIEETGLDTSEVDIY